MQQRHPTYDEFHGVAEGGIEQSAHGLAKLVSNFFGSKREDGGKGHDGEEVDGEDSGRAPVEVAGDYANGHHDEEEVDIVCRRRC